LTDPEHEFGILIKLRTKTCWKHLNAAQSSAQDNHIWSSLLTDFADIQAKGRSSTFHGMS